MKNCFNTILISLLFITTSFSVVGKNNVISDETTSKSTLPPGIANNQLATETTTNKNKITQKQDVKLLNENLPTEPVAKKETVTPSKKNKDDRFIPTEAISEDLAVSFPVDI